MKVNEKEFKKIYFECLRDILKFRPIDTNLRNLLTVHDYDYHEYNIVEYLEKSWKRCWKVYRLLPELKLNTNIKILDIGAFFGNFALCFVRLGYDVTVADVYHYYNHAFDRLNAYLQKENIKIVDVDFTSSLPSQFAQTKYDVVLCLAVLEHLPHSPKQLFDNIQIVSSKDTKIIIEVPNLAFWPKRKALLLGRSILSSAQSIYKSDIPYTGHHHEYTILEMRNLVNLLPWVIHDLVLYNYSITDPISIIFNFPITIVPSCREIILMQLIYKQDNE